MLHKKNTSNTWSYEDVVEAIRILTSYMSNELVDYEDFVSWHSTCKIAWQPLASDFFGVYMSRFVESAEARNKALYLKVPHVETFHRIRVLGAVNQVCCLVDEIVTVLRTISTYNVSQFRIRPSLHELRWHYDKTVPHLTASQIEVINRAAKYIKTRYGWDTSFVSVQGVPNKIRAPLRLTSSIISKNYALQVETSEALFKSKSVIL